MQTMQGQETYMEGTTCRVTILGIDNSQEEFHKNERVEWNVSIDSC